MTLWLTFGLGMASLAVTTTATLRMRIADQGVLDLALLLAAWAITLLTPPVVAVVALTLTSRNTRSGLHELLCMTNLSETALVQGYVFAALYRVRVWLAVAVGLMPALAVGMLQVGLIVTAIFSFVVYSPPYPSPPPTLAVNVLGPSLTCMAIAMGAWGMNLLAAALGVGLALRWRRNTAVAILAPLIMLLVALTAPVLALWVSGPAQMAVVALIALLAPYALAVGMMRLAQRWVCESADR